MACLECGLEQAVAYAGICARCGAPLTDPDYPSGAFAGAGGAQLQVGSAWIRRGRPYYMISLIFFLALYMIAVFGFEQTQGSGLHHPMEWGMDLGVCGALVSLFLFEAARGQFRVRQLVWGLVPLLSLALLRSCLFSGSRSSAAEPGNGLCLPSTSPPKSRRWSLPLALRVMSPWVRR
jgi:hypothetical protein